MPFLTLLRKTNSAAFLTGGLAGLLGGYVGVCQARLGVTECASHELLSSYPVMFAARGAIVAHFRCTVLLLPSGTSKVRKEGRKERRRFGGAEPLCFVGSGHRKRLRVCLAWSCWALPRYVACRRIYLVCWSRGPVTGNEDSKRVRRPTPTASTTSPSCQAMLEFAAWRNRV